MNCFLGNAVGVFNAGLAVFIMAIGALTGLHTASADDWYDMGNSLNAQAQFETCVRSLREPSWALWQSPPDPDDAQAAKEFLDHFTVVATKVSRHCQQVNPTLASCDLQALPCCFRDKRGNVPKPAALNDQHYYEWQKMKRAARSTKRSSPGAASRFVLAREVLWRGFSSSGRQTGSIGVANAVANWTCRDKNTQEEINISMI